jgi:hypothetical protein
LCVQQNSDTSIPSASLSTDAAQPAASADDKNLASIPGDTAAPAATDDTANAAEETTEQKQAREKGKFQRRLDRHKEARIGPKLEQTFSRKSSQRSSKHESTASAGCGADAGQLQERR